LNVEVVATKRQRALKACRGVVIPLLSLQYHAEIEVGLRRVRSGPYRAAHPGFGLVEFAYAKAAPARQEVELEAFESQRLGLEADSASLPTAPAFEQRRSLREQKQSIIRGRRQLVCRKIKRRVVEPSGIVLGHGSYRSPDCNRLDSAI
jgi:hypothetical protein